MFRLFRLVPLLLLPLLAHAKSDTEAAATLFQHDQTLGQQNLSPEAAMDALLADAVMVPLRRAGSFAKSKSEAMQALMAGPLAEGRSIRWQPVRVGVSADGKRGFTAGYQTITKSDGTDARGKYLAYWQRQKDGWAAFAYRMIPAPADAPLLQRLPDFSAPAVALDGASASLRLASLRAAEQAFSDRAQVVGLGPAFTEFGRDDALNLGGPANVEIVVGAKAIGTLVGGGEPATGSSVYWAADAAVDVADSGDLGVTFGFIRIHPGAEGDVSKIPPPIPFFTVWARTDAAQGWRYIAE
ncbi:hypothetical protein C7S18_21845 [Ahniella affigens]|uniref:DUF4440 domain-containing protein n=1 Tax=Ahniella affigens TaxID=2021234 RepID=A0A2P1PXU1_9GAMM|nr:DUF4440 domain-containing protein [Ahniella affigens]AVP99655.1 hypothetical protein C7S18_21845 [Ahniella affigens]